MEEIIAPTIAFLAGLWPWSSRFGTRPLAMVLGAAISVGAGLIATILTGEYFASWLYLLADIGGGVVGVVGATVAVRFVSVRRFIQRRP
jgi:hypothetical protein